MQRTTNIALIPARVVYEPVPNLAKPVVIVSEAMVEYAKMVITRSEALQVETQEDLKQAAKFLNEMSAQRTLIEETRLELGRPFRDENNRIKAESDLVVKPLSESMFAVSEKMAAYADKIERAAAAARAEQLRLTQEAAARQKEAEKKLETAGSEKQFEAAAERFDVAVEKQAEAEAVQIPSYSRPTGARVKLEPIIKSVDLAKLPLTYHMIDEAKVKRHILDKTITAETPGIVFEIKNGFAPTGRLSNKR